MNIAVNPEHPLLLAMIALIAWTLVIWCWMYVTRIAAVRKARMRLDSHAPRGEQMSQLPAPVRWKADNYNHLLEQPTLFYALCVVLVLQNVTGAVAIGCAWTYVVLRVLHSLVQTLGNIILLRFAVFTLSTLALFGMCAMAMWHGFMR